MNLEDLKTQWQSVKPHIEAMPRQDKNNADNYKRNDVKSKFEKRMLLNVAAVLICGVLMDTSGLWSPLKLPIWWIIVFSIAILVEAINTIIIYRLLHPMDLAINSHIEILSVIVRIKMFYRNMELVIAIIIVPLLIWLSFTPPFVDSWRMFYVWVITLLAFGGELFWYCSNLKLLSSFRASIDKQ